MSNAFYLPITLNVLPPRWITAAIVALHCLPLPLLLTVDGVVAWPLGAAAGLSLAFQLHRQRPAKAATRLEATTANGWLLYRATGDGPAHGNGDKVELIDQANLGGYVLLLMAQNRRRFRLVVRAGDQPREQWHRLRVLRVYEQRKQQAGRSGRPLSGR